MTGAEWIPIVAALIAGALLGWLAGFWWGCHLSRRYYR